MSGGYVPFHITPHHTMKLTIPSAPVSISEKGASILILGGSLWARRDALGPLSASGTYDIEAECSVRDLQTPNGRYSTIRIEKVLSAKPIK